MSQSSLTLAAIRLSCDIALPNYVASQTEFACIPRHIRSFVLDRHWKEFKVRGFLPFTIRCWNGGGRIPVNYRTIVSPFAPVAHEETTKVFVPAKSEKVSLSRYLAIYIGAFEASFSIIDGRAIG